MLGHRVQSNWSTNRAIYKEKYRSFVEFYCCNLGTDVWPKKSSTNFNFENIYCAMRSNIVFNTSYRFQSYICDVKINLQKLNSNHQRSDIRMRYVRTTSAHQCASSESGSSSAMFLSLLCSQRYTFLFSSRSIVTLWHSQNTPRWSRQSNGIYMWVRELAKLMFTGRCFLGYGFRFGHLSHHGWNHECPGVWW